MNKDSGDSVEEVGTYETSLGQIMGHSKKINKELITNKNK